MSYNQSLILVKKKKNYTQSLLYTTYISMILVDKSDSYCIQLFIIIIHNCFISLTYLFIIENIFLSNVYQISLSKWKIGITNDKTKK